MGEELEWGKEGWMDTVRRLADPPPDLVLAADCCYIDQVGLEGWPCTQKLLESWRRH